MMRLAAALGGFAFAMAEDKVVVGTTSTFDELVSANPGGMLVYFYAPWCGHCKKLEPEYTKAADILAEEGSAVKLVKIDATVEEKLAKDNNVNGYPTIKWWVGGSPTDYDGPRESQGIVDWIKSMTGPAVKESAPAESDVLSVTFYGADMTNFEEVAKANRKKASWYYVKASEDKMAIKHKDEEAAEYSGNDTEGMTAFFKAHSHPLFGGLDGDTFGSYMEKGNGMVWTLLEMTPESVSEVVEGKRRDMTSVAKQLGAEWSVTWTNTVDFKKVLESMFGVVEFPRVIVQKKVGDKKNYIYEGPITKDAVLEYVRKVEAGEVEAHFKSEEVPAEPQADPVKVVVGKSIETIVFSAEKDVMLEVYAPWCGHCKKLEPEYIKVAKKVQKEGLDDLMTIAKLDGTQNDSPVDSITWSGFPTMYYVKAGTSEPVKYDGARDAKGMWKWIKKNHSKAAEIKERIAEKQKDNNREEL